MSRSVPRILSSSLGLLLAASATGLSAQTKLLRFPDISGDKVAFTYGGDLWTTGTAGGTATRLTAHPGLELFAKFSPDGKWIAFTGQYDGDEQVYVIPATGGVPRQLTFYPARGPLKPRGGYDNQVMGWTPDGKSILFRSMRDANGVTVHGNLFTVPMAGGLPVKLPMPESGAGTFSPDGKKLAYTPLFRDFRHWKRYQGGWAEHLYIYDPATNERKPIAQTKRTERDPMWIGDRVYFASDRDGHLNLYSVDPATDQVKQHTFSKTWDVRWPSSDRASRIVYELDGELRIFDVKDGSDKGLSITVPTDGGASRPTRMAAEKFVESFGLSPKGERALFVAHGDVFTAPIEKGATRNLTHSSRAHDKDAEWSPDGRSIAFISDMSGEEQVYVVDQEGKGKPEALTSGLQIYLTGLGWSPDSKRIAFTDKAGTLYTVNVADKKLTVVAKDEFGRSPDFEWSPDSQYLAFTMGNANGFSSLYIWDGQVHRVTGDLAPVNSPAWDPEGRYLYALSRRDFVPQMSNLEFDYAGARNTAIFAYALRKDTAHPFPPESDEVTSEGEKKDEGKGPRAVTPIRIDFEGLEQRCTRVPVPADNIHGLHTGKGVLAYFKSGPRLYGGEGPGANSLFVYDLKKRKETELVSDVRGSAFSANGEKVLVRLQAGYTLLDVKAESKEKKVVSTKGLQVDNVPADEWAEIFDEVWRRYRDFFYVKNMHGYDWKALGDQYRPLLKHVTHRSDLTYILTEMISELNIGHAYVEGGDWMIPERAKYGLPGARFELDAKAGRFRLAKIFKGQNEEPRYRSPLTETGVDAHEGDYILAINGHDLGAGDDPYVLLRNLTDPVTLTLNAKPVQEGARKVTYNPIASEDALLYLDFVLESKARVDKLSGGKVGYIHIPDMGAPGIYEFVKWFYPQIRKEGLLIDDRANGGGNISQMVLERLGKKLLATRFGRESEHPGTYPSTVFHGPMACLVSETSASDGDIFPYHFRFAGLGPLIGKRTWGGVVGINGAGPLLDGGTVFVPLSGTNSPTGEWIIEGQGVTPDIEVENDPKSVIEGHDLQLERGVQEVLKAMEAHPMKLPVKPADPVKTN
jgi:tricorn protease